MHAKAHVDTQVFEEILGALPFPVQIFDADGTSLWMNEAHREFLGLPDRAVGVGEFNVLTDPFSVDTGNAEFFAKAYASGDPVTCPDLEVDLGKAAERWGTSARTTVYQQRILPLHGPDGGVRGTAAILTDVSAQRQVTATLDELSRSNETLEAFATMASHDLRTPLATLQTWLSLALEHELPDEAASHIAEAQVEAERMLAIVDRLRLLSMANLPLPAKALVDLHAVAHQAAEEQIESNPDPLPTVEIGDLPTVQGDAGLLRQVFSNLIGNAIKFSPDTPKVRIAATHSHDRWVITVEDEGIGIAEDPPDVFAPFVRLHGVDAFPGTGLGLAICRAVVLSHGGEISIGPRPAGGTVVTFTLPG